jgi:lipopolysaccharide/colanic/teichoic acid biosynthesis glycosyltransferase
VSLATLVTEVPQQRHAPVVVPSLVRRTTTQRTLDVIGSLLLLIVLAPLTLLIAVAVAATSPGGVLYRQTRVGVGGGHFTVLKFRTMHQDGHERRAQLLHLNEAHGVLFKIRRDPRVTGVGRILRRLSLDELPQLVNVLRGDMALVGPRPALPEEVARYSSVERERLQAVPGITGLWQVSGRSDLTWAQSVALDVQYVRRSSLALDLLILLRTVSAVATGRGAY